MKNLKAQSKWKQRDVVAASSWLALPVWAALAVGVVCCFYVYYNSSGKGDSFNGFDGTSGWPSITIVVFAALLSIHFIAKSHFDLMQNAVELAKEFGLPKKISCSGRESSLTNLEITPSKTNTEERVVIEDLWQLYLSRGKFWMRVLRTAPMTFLYCLALGAILPLLGDLPCQPMRGGFPFRLLMRLTIIVFLFLTFFVIDAILLHEGFLARLEKKETCWPDATFQKFEYSISPNRPRNESDLADYWDILFISRRTEAVGRLIYYPFVILSLLIVARLRFFYYWVWSPVLIVAMSLHFSVALYAAWRLPKVATVYRDKVLERLKRRRRQALILAQRTPEAIDTMIEEVQSTHQGAFSYLWEQPAIRALLLPSSGIGLATLLQYLPH
jgi:hypothetical protein